MITLFHTFDRDTRKPLVTAQTREEAIALSLPYGGRQGIFTTIRDSGSDHLTRAIKVRKTVADRAESIN